MKSRQKANIDVMSPRKWGMFPRLIVVLSLIWATGAVSYVGYQQTKSLSAVRQSTIDDCQSDRQQINQLFYDAAHGDIADQPPPEKQLPRHCGAEGNTAYCAAVPEAVQATAICALAPLPIFWIVAAVASYACAWVLAGRVSNLRHQIPGRVDSVETVQQ